MNSSLDNYLPCSGMKNQNVWGSDRNSDSFFTVANRHLKASLTTASLAQVDEALNWPESNLFCRDAGSI